MKETTLTCEERQFVDTLSKLLSVPAPPAFESAITTLVADELKGLGYAPQVDATGNLFLRLEGRSPELPHVMLAAHLDEIAIVVKAIGPDGTLHVTRSGGLLPYKTGERPFTFLGDNRSITGVITLGSGHAALHGGAIPKTWDDAAVITGLSPAELAEAGVRPGTPGVPLSDQRGPIVFGSPAAPLLGAWTLDDRAGVAVLIEWLRLLKATGEKPLHPVTVAWTIHEEGGCLGAAALAARERPDIFIAIDGTPWKAGDGYSVDARPVAWSKDQLANYDQRLLAHLRAAARESGTELQHAVLETGYSDASSVYKTGAAPRVALLGHARFNSHGYEVARVAVFPAVIRTLHALMGRNLSRDAG